MKLRPLSASLASAFVALVCVGAAAPATVSLPSWGVSVPVPEGFVRVAERSLWEGVRLEKYGPASTTAPTTGPAGAGSAKHLFSLQVARPPAGQTLEGFARKIAGERAVAPVKWGGRDGFELTGVPPKTEGGKDHWYAVRMIFAEEAGLYYALTYAAEPGGEDLAAYRQVVEGWAWSERAPVGKAIVARGSPAPLIGGLIADLPDPLRADPKQSKGERRIYLATDLGASKTAVTLVYVVTPPDPDAKTLDAVVAKIPPALFGDAKPVWRKLPGPADVAISDIFEGAGKRKMQGVVARSPEGHIHLFLFDYAPEVVSLEEGSKAAELLAGSITVAPR